MTNLEWIRTLSAKELSDLLYDYWLPRGQYAWTDSRKGLIKVLSGNYIERDCAKCKHQNNCYCVKGLGCPFEPKTEPQFDKDINVRSKYKQGTWLYGDGVYCSCCGYKLETTALLAKCPKCGADMSKTDCAWK